MDSTAQNLLRRFGRVFVLVWCVGVERGSQFFMCVIVHRRIVHVGVTQRVERRGGVAGTMAVRV